MYIAIEGIARSGGSTVSEKLKDYLGERFPGKTIELVREPGGTEIAEALRDFVQGNKFKSFKEEMSPSVDSLLYAAARVQLFYIKAQEVLDGGGIVIGDRSAVSSLAIQGHTSGLGIDEMVELNFKHAKIPVPDLVINLIVDVKEAKARESDADGDKWEDQDVKYHKTVEEGYRIASKHPIFEGKWQDINSNGLGQEEVFKKVLTAIESYLANF